MLRMWAVAGIALSSLVIFASGAQAQTSPPPPARPADGSYKYVIRQGAVKVGESTITVRGAGAAVLVDEQITIGDLRAKVTSSYSALTLSQMSYSLDATTSGRQQRVKASTTTDGIFVESGAQSVDIQAIKDSPTMVIGDNLVNSMFMLPARLGVAKATGFTMALLAGGRALRGTLSSTTTGSFTVTVAGLDIKYTYDPATLVVKTIEVPAQNAVFSLVQ